ncbi:MAG: hypothetical protein JWM62_2241 [Frankiales bacterium]|jgi:hypothetical protein|nr:hypothetical protein [Frankiales bacterium]
MTTQGEGYDIGMHPELQAAYARFEAAQGKIDREELVVSRLALCLALIETGWTAPEAVQEQMRRDEKTLRRLRETDTIDLTGPLDLPTQRPLAVSPLI